MGDVYDDYQAPTREDLAARTRHRHDFIIRETDRKIKEFEDAKSTRHYVVGLAHDGQRMAFVKKNRPEWQAGKLNGIGGKVEKDESYEFAMVREFEEETTVLLGDWRPLVDMTYPGQAKIVFYTARTDARTLDSLYTATDEAIEVHSIEYVRDYPHLFIRNLHWIVPLALAEEEYVSVEVTGHTDPVNGQYQFNSTK